MSDYVVIRDMSAGNDSVGEMWQETKIFGGNATLDQVMEWAVGRYDSASTKHVQITRPDNSSAPELFPGTLEALDKLGRSK